MASGTLGSFGAVSSALFVGTAKQLNIAITGTWVGRILLERSSDGVTYHPVVGIAEFTGNTTSSFFGPGYRYRLKVTRYTSGTASYDIRTADAPLVLANADGQQLVAVGQQLLVNGIPAGAPVEVVEASRELTNADNGKVLEMGADDLTLTVPAGLVAQFGVAVIPAGLTSITRATGVTLNGATSTISRQATNNHLFAIVPRASAADAYVVTGT